VTKPQNKHGNPQSFNALMKGMKRHDLDRILRYTEDEVSGDSKESINEVESISEYPQQEGCSPQGKCWLLRTQVTNSKPLARRPLALDDDIEFSFVTH
jgi:hypothetical protein